LIHRTGLKACQPAEQPAGLRRQTSVFESLKPRTVPGIGKAAGSRAAFGLTKKNQSILIGWFHDDCGKLSHPGSWGRLTIVMLELGFRVLRGSDVIGDDRRQQNESNDEGD
jgi:hypothetical protein